MKIDDLTGRELDMAVARHVLGYEVEERIKAISHRALAEGRRLSVPACWLTRSA